MIVNKLKRASAEFTINALEHAKAIAVEVVLKYVHWVGLLQTEQAFGNDSFPVRLEMLVVRFQHVDFLLTTWN